MAEIEILRQDRQSSSPGLAPKHGIACALEAQREHMPASGEILFQETLKHTRKVLVDEQRHGFG